MVIPRGEEYAHLMAMLRGNDYTVRTQGSWTEVRIPVKSPGAVTEAFVVFEFADGRLQNLHVEPKEQKNG